MKLFNVFGSATSKAASPYDLNLGHSVAIDDLTSFDDQTVSVVPVHIYNKMGLSHVPLCTWSVAS